MYLGKCLYTCKMLSMRNLEETKDVTEWVNSFVIMEKKLPINSNNSHSPGHYEQETGFAWILET